MRAKTVRRMYFAIVGTTALALLSATVAALASWRIGGLFNMMASEHVPNLRAAQQLEISLLEQRGFVSSYLLGEGNGEWLEELDRRRIEFDEWISRARREAGTVKEAEILRNLEEVYGEYDRRRDEVVALYDIGEIAVAEWVFLQEVNVLYDRAYQLCENLVAASQSSIDSATARARRDVSWITWLAVVSASMTIGLGIALLGVFAAGLRSEQARGRYFTHLDAARTIQAHFLPDTAPELPGFEIHACCHPAEFAAGDYFDYLRFADGSLGIVVGDVAGHGVGPALLMASTRAYLRSLAETHTDISEILFLMNSILTSEIDESRFVTLLLCRIDPVSRELTYVNAGHTPGCVLDASGELKAHLDSTGFPLGIVPEANFPEGKSVALAPGEMVLLLTDGVLEARSPDGNLFGPTRALEVVRANRSQPAREIAEMLYMRVHAYVRPGDLLDDVTVAVIKVG